MEALRGFFLCNKSQCILRFLLGVGVKREEYTKRIKRAGFTLIEVILVLAALATVTALVVLNYISRLLESKEDDGRNFAYCSTRVRRTTCGTVLDGYGRDPGV